MCICYFVGGPPSKSSARARTSRDPVSTSSLDRDFCIPGYYTVVTDVGMLGPQTCEPRLWVSL